jgi:hypothetical protein
MRICLTILSPLGNRFPLRAPLPAPCQQDNIAKYMPEGKSKILVFPFRDKGFPSSPGVLPPGSAKKASKPWNVSFLPQKDTKMSLFGSSGFHTKL